MESLTSFLEIVSQNDLILKSNYLYSYSSPFKLVIYYEKYARHYCVVMWKLKQYFWKISASCNVTLQLCVKLILQQSKNSNSLCFINDWPFEYFSGSLSDVRHTTSSAPKVLKTPLIHKSNFGFFLSEKKKVRFTHSCSVTLQFPSYIWCKVSNKVLNALLNFFYMA